MGCRLILNADDFGSTEGANEAICRLYDAGVVTSASLMVGGAAARDAVRRAEARPGLAVGLHLALVHATSVLPSSQLPNLVAAGTPRAEPGRLRTDHERVGFTATFHPFRGPAYRREIRREAAAQFALFRSFGLPWSHLDSHVHFALTPCVFRTAMTLVAQYDVPAYRIPEDDYALYRRMDPADAARQRWLAAHFSLCCRWQRRQPELRALRTTQRCYGLFRTGRLDAEYLVRLVEALPDGRLELHCHPDLSTEAGVQEFAALSSPTLRNALQSRRVQLSTYSSLG